ncbi:MAG: PDZ domain-containing protein [Myxococcales bacterium]
MSFMISRKQLEEIAATVQGVPVWGCLPGSSAAEAGVRYGDIVLEVNGVLTPSIDEYLAARALRKDGFTLRLFRSGRELSVYVEFRPPADTLEALTEQLADGRYLSPESEPPPSKDLPS